MRIYWVFAYMNILYVIAGVQPGSGMAEAALMLCRHLRRLGHEITLATLDGETNEIVSDSEQEGVRVVRFPSSWPCTLYFSWQMLQEMRSLCKTVDLVHVHGMWTFPVWWGCFCALWTGTPLVISPHGCLSAKRLRRSALKKRIAGFMFDRRLLRSASAIHVTCDAEQHELEAYFQKMNESIHPVVSIVPNGVDVDVWRGVQDRTIIDQHWPTCRGKRVILFLGRIDPIKGLDLLIDAWRLVVSEFPDWHLLIVGPDEHGYAAHVQALIESASVGSQTTLGRSVYGEEKRSLMRASDVFVLPTYNENFGIAVAEALAAGVSVITTKGAPWAELLSEHCGWWVDVGVDSLADALREAMNLTDDERRVMGENGRRLVERKYQWKMVATQMIELYEKAMKRE